ncbi:hypothetical protein [Shewanella sp.]|uniref:hypothetical protein n=1 Tax=Shewanella sp. TaxID=50422 RepID=UPI002587DF87|nr:hypothetical protein [Shewanella sp.]MCJ8301435.1 hypothetical protein [Shewanella sp.]
MLSKLHLHWLFTSWFQLFTSPLFVDQDVTARQLAQTVAQLISPYMMAGEVKYYEVKDGTAYVVFGMDEDAWLVSLSQ